jgi:hypothetical protein
LIHKGKLLLLFTILLVISSCVNRKSKNVNHHIQISAELLSEDGKTLIAENDSSFFAHGAVLRSNLESRTGEYSVKTGKNARFAMGVSISDIGPDYYFDISIWRKSSESIAKLVVSSPESKQLYHMTSDPVERDSLGWEKLKLEFFTPPNFKYQEVKINLWNNGEEDAFFDDLEIIVKKRKDYPVYNENSFHIELDTSEYLKLQQVRIRAFKAGLLQSTDDDWVKGFVFSDGNGMKAKMRLKGDWLDHQHGEKWSFRIKLKGADSWNRMKVFSVQNPMARMGVSEWYLHQIYISESLLTTRYGFMPLSFKGKNLGLYAWEEHFTKHLIESQKRREGPILRFLEDAMWDTRVFNEEGKRNNKKVAYFAAAAIKPFSPSKIIEDSAKLKQFEIAQNLLLQYKNRLATASDIFNIDALAKYFATADVFFARHSIIWHNQRFYYNPVLCKLEPIAFDCFSDIGLGELAGRKIWGNVNTNSKGTSTDDYLMVRELFNDTAFVNVYIKYLEKYSSSRFLDSMSEMYLGEALVYDSLLKMEFTDYSFDTSLLYANVENVRNELPVFKENFKKRKENNLKLINTSIENPKLDTVLDDLFVGNLVNCYLQEFNGDSMIIRVKSFFPEELTILGVGRDSEKMINFLVPALISESYLNGDSELNFSLEKSDANFLFFTRKDGNKIMSTEIFQWKEPDGSKSPLQQLQGKYSIEKFSNIYELTGNKIIFKNGVHQLNHPLIIPVGYEVVFNKSTTLNLTNSAFFLSYSPIYMNGTKENPILITSSDFSANSFTVLQADGRSSLKNVKFENLNTLNYKGWTLTGAVVFYESDVDLENVTFYRNQCEDALNIVRSDFNLNNSRFDYIFADAFDSDFSTGKVENTIFTNIGNDAIDFSGSEIFIENTQISNVSDKGISGGEDSHLIVSNVKIQNANIGIASKDLSVVDVVNSEVSDCNYGIVLLQKKPEYGPATMKLENVKFLNSKMEKLIELKSFVIEDGIKIKGVEKNVATLFY